MSILKEIDEPKCPRPTSLLNASCRNDTSVPRPTVISTEVEKSHPSMLHAAVRQEISRLRVSIERSSISPYRHAAPLEMTRRRGSIGSWEKE